MDHVTLTRYTEALTRGADKWLRPVYAAERDGVEYWVGGRFDTDAARNELLAVMKAELLDDGLDPAEVVLEVEGAGYGEDGRWTLYVNATIRPDLSEAGEVANVFIVKNSDDPRPGMELEPVGSVGGGSGSGVVGPADILGEIVDGEVVSDRNDFRWKQWWEPERTTTNYHLEIDQTWYQRVPRSAWARLDAALTELQALGKL